MVGSLDLGEGIGAAFRVAARRLPALAWLHFLPFLILLPGLVALAVTAALAERSGGDQVAAWTLVLMIPLGIAALVAFLVTQAAAVYLAAREAAGETISWREALHRGWRRGAIVLVSGFVSGLLTFLGLLLLCVPGILLAVMYAVVPAVAVAEDELDAMSVLRRSTTLTHGNRVNVFLFFLVVQLVGFALDFGYRILSSIVQVSTNALLGSQDGLDSVVVLSLVTLLSSVVGLFVFALKSALQSAAQGVMYQRLHVLHHGASTADVASLAEVFG